VTLSLDMDGVIQLVTFANSVSGEVVDAWVGRHWADTVDDRAGALALGMVAEARVNGVSDFRRLTQRFPSGLELPFEYTMVRLGDHGGLVAVGKNLKAVAGLQSRLLETQHTREQDAWKLRELETRNRLLFDHSDDPIVLLRASDCTVVEANPAAVRTGALDSGRNFPGAIAARDLPAFHAMMAQMAETGRSQGTIIHIGSAGSAWLVRASRAEPDPDTIIILRMSPAATSLAPLPVGGSALMTPAGGDTQAAGTSWLEDLLERLPDGFALIDEAGRLRRANPAFFDLVRIAAPAAALGEPIGRWLSHPGADAAVLLDRLRRYGSVRNFATILHGELGAEATVEISAAAQPEGAVSGMVIRDVSRRLQETASGKRRADAAPPLLASLTHLSERVGQVPLMQLVRDSGDFIERHCIEEALDRAAGNRTAAAGLLGLSRQSLYAKLARHGIGGGGSAEGG
jgi:transcriptional regulator PpsR